MTPTPSTAIETVSDERLREHLSFDGWHAFKSLTEAEVKSVVTEALSRRSLDTADGVDERVTAALQTALVAMSLASALPGVSAEYDFSAAISAIEEVL